MAASAGGDADGQVAQGLDREDPLRDYRGQFYVPDNRIYLDGNSLGLLCRPAEASLLAVLGQWRQLAIGGWLEAEPPWFELAERLGAELAPLVGAGADEIVVTGSTTINLHQLLATFFHPGGDRSGLLIDATAFPTDRYAAQSHLRLRGLDAAACLRIVQGRDRWSVDETDIVAAMDDSIQLAILPSVIYTSGRLLDIPYLVGAAHRRGIRVAFDCSHSAGVVPHALSEWQVDFAFFCTYKYLNGGPGSPAAVFVHRRHWGNPPGLAGWFGGRKNTQFEMADTFAPCEHAGALQIGTPHILSMAPLLGALPMLREAGLERIRQKSQRLTTYLRTLIAARLEQDGISFADPAEASKRGGHIAVRHADAAGISRSLRAAGVIGDYRPPDVLRFAPSPLYTSFDDCYRAAQILERIVRGGGYEQGPAARQRIP
jgi:kynureninase